ncbi:carbamoyltransferase [Pseudahrensia aquimaris]|uniref:Carbamoyltransferase n=1 Tax=Pseudahrensia aquimaris TaxID=744461 RepID=A0ABW3FEM8_9HYPH
MTTYLGFSCSQHDPSIAVVNEDGEVVFAEANERALKYKRGWHAAPDPFGVIEPIMDDYVREGPVCANLTWTRTSLRASSVLAPLSRLAIATFKLIRPTDEEAMLWRGWYFRHALYRAPTTANNMLLNVDLRLRERSGFRFEMRKQAWNHHLCHAATACYSSPYDKALCVVVDGMGEGASTAFFSFENGELQRLDSKQFANLASLGIFYSQVCYAIGFDPLAGEEWKVMGLAAYGEVDEELYDLLRPVVRVDGSRFSLSRSHAAWFEKLLSFRKRGFKENADLACTAQKVFEDVLFEFLTVAHERWGGENLVLTGGCALNSSANGKIVGSTPFKNLHVPMAPGDDGNSVGAALLAWKDDHPNQQVPRFTTPYLGSKLSQNTQTRLLKHGMKPCFTAKEAKHLAEFVAGELARGAIVGWVQGRAEFGHRALGNRSILADPRSAEVRERLNSAVKFREEFRPFAPAILHEHGPEYFDDYEPSPYMERALQWKAGCAPEGVRHADDTGRLQSVTQQGNPLFHELISAFHRETGVPILLNTSFNVMGRPMVHDIEDALGVFFTSDLGLLVLDDVVFKKND